MYTLFFFYHFLSESKIADYIGHWYAGHVNIGQAQLRLTNFLVSFSGQRELASFEVF